MFFCVLLISTTNISDSNINYTNNQFYSNLYNVVSTAENIQQNTIFENLLRNDKMQTEDGADFGRDKSINKINLDSDLTYDQYAYETENLALTLNKDSEEPFQHTKSTNSLNQDYSILDISAYTPQYWNDVFSDTDVSHTNKVERTLPFTNNNHIPAQTNMYSDACLLIQIESIPVTQENESLAELLKACCTDYYTEFNNQNIDDPDFENEWYKKICSYINWEPSEYDNKKNFFQEFNFEDDNNNLVDPSFKHCGHDKHTDVQKKEINEYSNISNTKSLNNDELVVNNTKEHEKGNADCIINYNSFKSFLSDDSNIEIFDILIENKKELQALKDKFFFNVRKQSSIGLIQYNFTKNNKYRNNSNRIILNSNWFNDFTNVTFKLLMDDIETLYLSENTKKLFCEWVEFLREVAQFIFNFKEHVNLKKYSQCDVLSNLTLIETIMNSIILKFNFEKIKNFLEKIIQKHKNPKFFDLKVEKVLLKILYNIKEVEEKFKQYRLYFARMKMYFEGRIN
ncbi:hypothetical protein AAJ76_160005057 [Vairimorpha ceranae]|uniref:Uncharacterized protein n=1 Tax=Vairimorpha ceranae TaxID=40302 RepID=A0A0F9WRS6_9MICR|nr:hypothetical protein AAJ76_160005057 [Vairimorpha ceranae]KKO75598.1 hypothetical protein AAJ76_160005057 [Vairimorpha ceranae]